MSQPIEQERLRAKAAEVRFRSRIPGPDSGAREEIQARRSRWLRPLKDYVVSAGRPGEPFLEVACGARPRSTFLTAELGLRGLASDLSLKSLLNARERMNILGISAQPTLVCADAESLPFPDGSLAFLFSYEFLHHLPTPEPFLREVRRLLAKGGRFHFDGEPFAPRFRLHPYRRASVACSQEERDRHVLVRLFRYYLCDPHCRAAEEGILEKMDMRLRDWQNALTSIKDLRLSATTIRGGWSVRDLRPRGLSPFVFDLIGGNIQGEWRAPGPGPGTSPKDMQELLCCPACLFRLSWSPKGATCDSCGEAFPIVEGIPVLIPEPLRVILYPSLG